MKSRFHNTNQKYSIVRQVPVKIQNSMVRTLEEIFNRNAVFTVGKKASGVIKHYGNDKERSCRFTMMFEAPLEYPDLAEPMILKIVDWTISESKAEYDRRQSEAIKKQLKKLKKEYKELKFDRELV